MNQGKKIAVNNYTLRISTTSACNLNCSYCNPNRDVDCKKDMSDQDIIDIIQAGVIAGVRKVSWTGGEPTVRKNFLQLVAKAKKLGIEKQSMTTNGILFYKIGSKLKKAGLTKVNFSLDTLTSENYKKICRYDGFDLVKKSIKKALELYPQVKVNCVIMKDNVGIIDEFVKFGETFKGRLIIRFLEVVPCGEIYEKDKNIFKNSFVPMKRIIAELEKYGKLKPVKIIGDVPKSRYYHISGLTGIYGVNPNYSVNYCCDKNKCPKIRINPQGFVSNCTIQLKYVRDFRNKSLEEKIELMKEIVKEKASRNYKGFTHRQKYYDFWRFGNQPEYIKKKFK